MQARKEEKLLASAPVCAPGPDTRTKFFACDWGTAWERANETHAKEALLPLALLFFQVDFSTIARAGGH